MSGWMDGRTDGWMDGWMDSLLSSIFCSTSYYSVSVNDSKVQEHHLPPLLQVWIVSLTPPAPYKLES